MAIKMKDLCVITLFLVNYFFASQAELGLYSYSCGEPTPIKHGTMSIIGGSLSSYQCHPGFSLYGSQNLRCQRNGQWSGETPICVAPGCSPLPTFPRGRMSIRMNGAVVVYKCQKGTWVKGSKTIFCDGSRWNDTVPTCQANRINKPNFLPISNCPLPPKVPDAVALRGFEDVSYMCVNRTIPTLGSRILRCLSTGQWDRPPVICAKPGCPRLSEPRNGMIIEMHGLSVVEFRCFLHYHLIGSKILYCNGRRWNGTVPSCVEDIPLEPSSPSTGSDVGGELQPSVPFTVEQGTTCGQSHTIRNGLPRYATELDDRGVTYWSVEYVCDPGFQLLRRAKLFCSKGVWVGEIPQCVAHCGVNNGGCSHNCLSINGRATCTCRPGYRLHINGRSCADVNECRSNSGRGPCSEFCTNIPGGYVCRCQRGFRLNEDGHTCSYQEVDPCSRIRCAYGSCVLVNGTATCQCPRGYELSRLTRTCEDINECSRPSSPCEHGCRNTIGNYECFCPPGSALLNSGRCQVCEVNTYVSVNGRRCLACPQNSVTSDARQTSIAACRCQDGFEGNPERGRPCQDINECSDRNGGCRHACVNTRGSYFCKCSPGFTLDEADQHSCIEIDECALNNGGCQHECRNAPGSYSCICNVGYAVDPNDRFTCTDVDECAFDSTRCEQVCINTRGGYRCECNRGFRLNNDSRTCTAEICDPLTSPLHGNISCHGEPVGPGLSAGTTCAYHCQPGYGLKGGEHERTCLPNSLWSGNAPRCVRIRCPVLSVPEFGRLVPGECFSGPGEVHSVCTFSCSTGYRLLGHSELRCSINGDWSHRSPICSRDAQIRCPDDITVTLPRGSSKMVVDLPEADHILDFLNVSHPLSGHVFSVGKSKVTFTSYSIGNEAHASCTMTVKVIDEESPQATVCPSSYTMKVEERMLPSLNTPQPVFTDNVAITNVSRVVEPAGIITWGTYTVRYVAADAAGNIATCSFTVTIQPLSLDCGVLDGPLNGNSFCSPWLHGQICQPTCLPGYYFFDGPLVKPTYVCGRDAQWDPAKKAPDCTSYELVRNTSVPCSPGKQLKDYPPLEGPSCMDCPRGMYSVDLGSTTQPVCKQCPRGLYQDQTGQTSCLVCPTGTTTTSTGATNRRQCRSSSQGAVTTIMMEPSP